MNSSLSAKTINEVLDNQPIGRRLAIKGFCLPPDIHQRLLEMGLTPGTECAVNRYAPLGDPLEITVRGYSLVLRRTEARGVHVSII